MKRFLLFCAVLLFAATPAWSAMSYGLSHYVANRAYIGSGGSNDPLYNFINEVETDLEAVGVDDLDTLTFAEGGTIDNVDPNAFEFNANSDELILSFGSNTITASSGDVTVFDFGTIVLGFDQFKVNATTYTFPTSDGTSGQVLQTNASGVLSWTTNGGTFTGGNITSDCTLSNGVDLQTTTTSGHAATLKVYDNDTGPGYTNVLSWTNGNTPAVAMGSDTSSFALNSTAVDITTAGAVSGVTDLTSAGTISLNDSASTNTTSIGGGTTTGAISIGTGASAQALNIGTGGGAKTVTLGSTNSTSTTNIQSGSNGVNINVSNNQPTTIGGGTTTAAVAVADGASTQTVNLGTGAGIKTVTLGSTNSTSTTNIQSGSNAVNINASVNNPTNINTGTSTAAVTIGGGSGTFAVASTGLDISTAGAISSVTTLGVTDAITLSDGLTIDQPTDNYFEITENSDTLQLIFGSNTLELGAGGTGVDTIDFNDVDTLTDIESIALESGLTISQPVDNYLEFTENSDTLQMIFGSNVLELGSGGTGVVTIDFNDVDRLTDIEYVEGDEGARVDLSIDERVEFKDGGETFGFILDGENIIELCTDSGVTTLDFNDIDTLTDIDVITLEQGLTISQPADDQLEFTEKGDTLQLIFDSNDIELGSGGTGVVTIDFNDVDKLEDVEYVAGDNGAQIDLSIDERVEFKDAAETFGFILDGTNTIELCTDSGVTTLDFNDIDALTDIESITGHGTGAIEGFFDTVVNDADGMAQGTLTAADAGTLITNAGAGGAMAYVLPEGSTCIGAKFTFVVMAAVALRVDPYDATDQILRVTSDAGDYYEADAIGETIVVQCVGADSWVVISETGTWTEE